MLEFTLIMGVLLRKQMYISYDLIMDIRHTKNVSFTTVVNRYPIKYTTSLIKLDN